MFPWDQGKPRQSPDFNPNAIYLARLLLGYRATANEIDYGDVSGLSESAKGPEANACGI